MAAWASPGLRKPTNPKPRLWLVCRSRDTYMQSGARTDSQGGHNGSSGDNAQLDVWICCGFLLSVVSRGWVAGAPPSPPPKTHTKNAHTEALSRVPKGWKSCTRWSSVYSAKAGDSHSTPPVGSQEGERRGMELGRKEGHSDAIPPPKKNLGKGGARGHIRQMGGGEVPHGTLAA